jgi:putative ABC transport system permease protein
MSTLIQDVKYGLRMLARNPGFTAVAVLTLALGIGANTAIFSVVNAALLKPLPYNDADRLVMVWEQNPERGWYRNIVSAANFLDWRKQNHVFTQMAAADPQVTFNLSGTGRPEEVWGEQVTTNLFSLLGVRPMLGRDFLPEEDKPGGPRVVLLGHGLWQSRYGGDRKLIGQQILLNGESYTVIGVMPRSFYFPPFWRELIKVDLWVAGLDLSQPDRTWHEDFAVARLKPGVGLAQAQAEMNTIASRIVQEHPEDKGWGVGLVSLREQTVGETRTALLVLFGAVAFVLMIACANVANLMLARATAREKEIALRTALGASRGGLIRQFLTESLLLALAGAGVGLWLAYWGISALVALAPQSLANLVNIEMDDRVLGFALAIACLTTLLFGLVPAIGASKPDLNASLKEGGRTSNQGARHRRLRGVLVACEFALALILLIGAGLMIKTLVMLGQVDLGFNTKNVLTMRIPLLGPKYQDPRRQVEFFSQLVDRVAALTGVQYASVSRGLPVEGWSGQDFVTEDNPSPGPNEVPDANYLAIGPDYFRVMSIPLLEGRFFTNQDTQTSTKVVIVNEKLARSEWPGQNPIGKRLKMGPGNWPWMTVVGVVGNVKTQWPDEHFFREIYVPYTQYPWVVAPRHLIVRTTANAAAITAGIRRIVAELDKDQPVSDVRPLAEVVGLADAQQRFSMLLLGIFAFLAVALASVGIYGVMSYAVTRRTHEIGVRMALGATRSDVLRLVVREGMALATAGTVAGLAAALALTRFLSSLLYGVRPIDPLTFAAVSAVLASIALLACYIPARRATRVDPTVALRYE